MSEQGERLARLEAQVEQLESIEKRLRAIERWQATIAGGLAALQLVLFFLKH